MIKWIHIMDSQPDHGREIIQIDAPFQGHYSMGMRTYYQTMLWKDYLACCKEHNLYLSEPDFWWVYLEDFPFPKNKDDP